MSYIAFPHSFVLKCKGTRGAWTILKGSSSTLSCGPGISTDACANHEQLTQLNKAGTDGNRESIK